MSESEYLNSHLGEEHKSKLREIAENQKRDMTSQIQVMIDDFYQRLNLDAE